MKDETAAQVYGERFLCSLRAAEIQVLLEFFLRFA